jgi:hypothetical protein
MFEGDQRPKNGADLGRMFASSRLSVDAMARGEVVARAAIARANGTLDLSMARGMKTSVLPGAVSLAQLSELPEPILVKSLAAFERHVRSRPPTMLGPRRMGDRMHVVSIARVVDVAYDAAEQTVTAIALDADDAPILLETRHRAVSPGAVDAVHRALSSGPLYATGEPVRTNAGWFMAPVAIVTRDRFVVVDLEPRVGGDLPERGAPPSSSAVHPLLASLDEVVDRGVHKGWAQVQAEAGRLGMRMVESLMARTGALCTRLGDGDGDALLELAILRRLMHEAPSFAQRDVPVTDPSPVVA